MSPIDLLGWSGSILVVLSLTQSSLRRLRLINLAASLIHLAFNLILGIVPMIALNVALASINSYFLLAKNPVPKPEVGATTEHPVGRWRAPWALLRRVAVVLRAPWPKLPAPATPSQQTDAGWRYATQYFVREDPSWT